MAQRKVRGPKVIEMDGKLPLWPEDDVEFIYQNLKRPCSISGFLTSLGIDAVSGTGQGRSSAWYRISAGFRKGLAKGRLTKEEGQKGWRRFDQERESRAS